MKRAFILLFFMLGCLVIESKAQKIAVKSNLLYDATTTVNLGLEFGLARKWTLDIPVNYNPWKPDNGRRLRHWGVQPEVRYWFCESFNRTFVGLPWTLCRLQCRWLAGYFQQKYAKEPISGTSVWRRHFGRAFLDIEKTLEYRSVCRSGICTYRI